MEDFDFDNIVIDEKWHENVLIYDISYKTLIVQKLLCSRFNKIDEFIRIMMEFLEFFRIYLTLVGYENYHAIYNRIRYLISLKNIISYIFSRYFVEIKVDYYDSLPTEKRLSLHNVMILIKSFLNKDKYHYFCKAFLEKCSNQLAKK